MVTLPMELELRKLGLTEKEVKIYLAGLELGPSSVQKLAQKIGLSRPTAYEIIKKLEDKRLFAETTQNKKRYFVAQSPKRILGILRVQKKEIEEREREFIRIIAALESEYLKEEKGVEIFKGREGLNSLAEIISFSPTPNIIVVNPKRVPIKNAEMKKIYQKIKKRLGRLMVKEISSEINGSLIIFDKIVFFSRKGKKAFLFS